MISGGFEAKLKFHPCCGVVFYSADRHFPLEVLKNSLTNGPSERSIEERLVNNGVAAAVYDADRCAVVVDKAAALG